MQKHHLYILVALSLLSLFACKKKVEPTVSEIISKTWKISRATFNGIPDTPNLYLTFRLRLTSEGNYTIIIGNAPAKPNRTSSNTGRWVLESNNTQMVMDKGTPNEAVIFLVGTPTDQALSLRFRQDKAVNKTEPEYTFEMVPE
jgi:hypothetical protein